MSCSIDNTTVVEWTLKPEHVEDLYQYLYDKVEHGGEILLDTETKSSSKVVKTNTGKVDSVDAPDSIVGFHAHPINCYNNEKTIWGWPSGEDMRETLIYGLRGSACHVVPAVEGTYTMQPNPCIISGLMNIDNAVDPNNYSELASGVQNWGNFLRGLVVATIEVYFRSTHVFRSVSYMKKYQDIRAYDFIQFANIFKLENLFTKHQVKGCSKLGCNEIIKYENQRMSQIPFEDYVYDYESDTVIYYVDKHGESTKSKIKYLDALEKGGLELLKNLTIGSNCVIPVKKWHTSTVFQLDLYNNKVSYNGKWHIYSELNFADKYAFLKGPHQPGDIVLSDRIIKFKLFDLKGKCNHDSLKSHMGSYETKPRFERKSSKKSGKKSSRKSSRKSKHRRRSYGQKQRSRRKSRSPRKSRKGLVAKSTGNVIKEVLIIGSVECPHCKKQDKKAQKKRKTHKFKYSFKEYPTIKEAIDEAQKLNSEINAIPAIFVNGKYTTESLF